MYYLNDLAKAAFGGADQWRKSRATPQTEGSMGGMEEEYEMMMSEQMMEYEGMYPPGVFMPGAETQDQRKQGFVVTVVGYSPYGANATELSALLDPHGVENQREKWGFVTRLANLDALDPDANSPFQLYEKTDPEQFKLEIKEVSLLDAQMTPPEGIGIWQEQIPKAGTTGPRGGTTIEWALADPMTNEIISKIAEKDETGKQRLDRAGKPLFKVNDHWFWLNAKFVWKNAPPPPALPSMYPYGMPTAPATTGAPSAAPSPPPSSSRSRGRSGPDIGDM